MRVNSQVLQNGSLHGSIGYAADAAIAPRNQQTPKVISAAYIGTSKLYQYAAGGSRRCFDNRRFSDGWCLNAWLIGPETSSGAAHDKLPCLGRRWANLSDRRSPKCSESLKQRPSQLADAILIGTPPGGCQRLKPPSRVGSVERM